MNHIKRIPHNLIESFLVAVEGPSLQEAAGKLGLTQSALSRQMQLFEEHLPHKVFTLVGRKKVLTRYGTSLYEVLSPRFLKTQELIEQTSLKFADVNDVHLKICGRGELLDMVATSLGFKGQVSFQQMDNESAVQAILDRSCDIGIVHSAIDSSELILKPYLTNSFVIAVPKVFIKSKPPSLADLIAKLPSIPALLYKSTDTVFEKFLVDSDLNINQIKIFRIYANYASLVKMVNEELGWAIVPSHIQGLSDKNHIFSLDAKLVNNRKFYLCYRRELTSSVWFKDMIAELRK